MLLAHAVQKDRSWLFAWPEKELSTQQQQQFENFLQRRLRGEPVSYITGYREFWGMDFKVSPDTLIPRPETELLVETALSKLGTSSAKVLELGTGTGAISVALLTERPAWNILATEVNAGTLAIARENLSKVTIPLVRPARLTLEW